MTRLSELSPRWIGYTDTGIIIGISFDCPHCHTQKLAAFFTNPIDPNGKLSTISWPTDNKTWNRTGSTFEDISLVPSIDCSSSGHWHGVITNGNIS